MNFLYHKSAVDEEGRLVKEFHALETPTMVVVVAVFILVAVYVVLRRYCHPEPAANGSRAGLNRMFNSFRQSFRRAPTLPLTEMDVDRRFKGTGADGEAAYRTVTVDPLKDALRRV